ncbi:MAG: beta-N-acetylhexosaminidase [Planctomycetota bacterium]
MRPESTGSDAALELVPRPARIERLGGWMDLEPTVQTLDAEAAEARGHLTSRAVGVPLRPVAEGGGIRLRVDPELTRELGAEGYRLTVDDHGVALVGAHAAGLHYGVETLAALIDTHPPSRLPRLVIEDRPRYSWRGMHLDVGRHFFDVDFVRKYIDLLALHKLNRFHWHLTEDQGWRLAIAGRPRLTTVGAFRSEDGASVGGYYTAAQVRAVVEYARARHVVVVPEIEMPGHAMAALASYPELSCTGGPFAVATEWGVFDDVFCAGNDATFAFLFEVLDEVLALFPSEFIHIGGDECPKVRWRQCASCQARMRAEGLRNEDELQSWFLRRVGRHLAERGRRMIGWDEILEGGLAPGAAVMSWRGTAGGVAAARAGHDVVMSPTSHCYFDYKQVDSSEEPGAHGVIPLATVYTFDPTPPELSVTEARHVLGGQGNVWTERMRSGAEVETMTIPRICALAETLWSPPEARHYDDFRTRLTGHVARLVRRGYRSRGLE